MKYFLIAGEASGDLHGSYLIKALRQADPQAQICAWGGDLMQTAGAQLLKHYRDTAYMGFVEVVKHLPDIWRNLRTCRHDIEQFAPDAVLLIDYPGFNLRIAPFAHQKGYRVFYYISPQVWAWKANRVQLMRQYIEQLYAILPFEPDFYRQYGWNEVQFVGHPLLDALNDNNTDKLPPLALSYDGAKPVIALLPGSRTQEISRMLPTMLEATILLGSQYRYAVAGAPAVSRHFYAPFLQSYPHISLINGQTHALLRQARGAIVTSGTATLETALLGVPQVVVYKGNALSYYIARRLVKVRYISLVNLIADQTLVTELIQDQATPQNIAQALQPLLPDGETRTRLLDQYAQLHRQLGGIGASQRVAEDIVSRISI